MRVLIADAFEKIGVDGLTDLGCEVTHEPTLKGDDLATALAEVQPEVLIVRSTKVPDEIQEHGGSLKLIIRAGAGYDNIDTDAAARRGIKVAACPGMNSVAVAELAFGLIAALDRRIPDNVASLKAGEWKKGEYGKAQGLAGRTLGIIGLGSIGKALAKRAQAFDMPVIAWSRSLTDEKAAELGIKRCQTPEEVAENADIVSVHLASSPDTKGMIDAEFLSHLKDGAFFINTARANVMDADALARAIDEKGLKVGLDVWPDEPTVSAGEFSSELIGKPGVIGTAHIGASTTQAQNAIAGEVVRIVTEFKNTGVAPNVVNGV